MLVTLCLVSDDRAGGGRGQARSRFAPSHFNKMLNQLPNETISNIVANLLHVDLKRLSLVSYRTRAITLPFLFRSLVFVCPEGYCGKKALLRLKGLAASNSVLPLVHRVTMSGSTATRS